MTFPEQPGLGRRVPLNSGGLPRRTGLRRTGRLRGRSRKTDELYVQRRALVARLLAERPVCQARLEGCAGRSVDVHEVVTRGRGGSILDESNLLCLCRACHDFCSAEPDEACRLGLVKHSWERDVPAD